MSTNSQEQEIDLGQLFNKASNFFKKIIDLIFDLIFFIRKKIIIIIILFIVGVALAYLADGKKNYNHEISVIPNFGSSEFLYKKINEIDVKLREQDPIFFKNIGISNYEDILSIKIEAFPGVYAFINSGDKEANFKMIELLAEDGDIAKILSSDMTTRNFYHHKITIKTKGMWKRDQLIDPILNFLNNNPYFLKQQKVSQENLKDKIAKNDSLIKQIDEVITQISSSSKTSGNILISEASNIFELVDKKDELIQDSYGLKRDDIIYDSIIKEESSIINTRNYVPIVLNSKIVFPIVLILIFLISFPIMNAYKKQKLRIERNK